MTMTRGNSFRGWTRPVTATALILSLGAVQTRAATAKAKLDLYVMSLCPFGTQAEAGALPAVKSLAKYVDLNLHFIGGTAASADGMPHFTSLHGDPEVAEDIRQVCAMRLYPDKFMDYILARNKAGVNNAEWRGSAQAAGLDPAKIEECSKGPQGAAWFAKSLDASSARGANSSPTIDIDGVAYTGGRGQRSFTAALCKALTAKGAPAPEACGAIASLPADEATAGSGCGEPTAVGVKVVVDNGCKACGPTLIDSIKTMHPGAKISIIDGASTEGASLVKQYGAKSLPLYILGKEVEQEGNFKKLNDSFYAKSGDGYVVRPGAISYIPSVQLDRKRQPRHVDVFLESLSFASAQAENELLRFFEKSNVKDLTFSVHFIVQEAAKEDAQKDAKTAPTSVRAASLAEFTSAPSGPLTSANGSAEVQEDIRQLCLFQHASIGTFFKYLNCRNQNLSDFSRSASCLISEDLVKNCAEGKEGAELLRRDAQLAWDLGITSGPSLMWENRYGPFGWNEVEWKSLISGNATVATSKPSNAAAPQN